MLVCLLAQASISSKRLCKPWVEDFKAELQGVPNYPTDDQADTFAQAVIQILEAEGMALLNALTQ